MPQNLSIPVKNIIFDLGVVILNVDYNLTTKAFKKLGIDNFDEHFSKAKQDQLFDKLETGRISANNFRKELRNHLPAHVTDEQIDEAWNAMLMDLPKPTFEILKTAKKKYRTFLLSNTNEIHIKAFSKIIEKEYGMKQFNALFEKIYYSNEVQMRKPDKEIFELVLKENKLNPNETLFIDDSPQHIEGANKVGIKAILLEKGKELTELLKEKNLL
jgi:glucose-1-phosphatase